MKWKTRILFTVSLCSLWQAPAVWPSPAQTAEEVVVASTEAIYRAIQDQCGEIEQNPIHLHKLVEEILIPHADFTRMAQLALGKHWQTAETNLRSEFVIQFRHLLIRTYSTAVQMASLEAIRYLPSRAGTKPGTITVRTEVRRPGEPLVTINYRLYQKGVEWLVYDILVDGISLVSNYRSTFAEEIANKGFSGLVSVLEKKNQRPVIQSNADLIRRRAIRACKQATLPVK